MGNPKFLVSDDYLDLHRDHESPLLLNPPKRCERRHETRTTTPSSILSVLVIPKAQVSYPSFKMEGVEIDSRNPLSFGSSSSESYPLCHGPAPGSGVEVQLTTRPECGPYVTQKHGVVYRTITRQVYPLSDELMLVKEG